MTPADETRTQRHLAADQAASAERTRPPEGPDREALGPIHRFLTGRHHALPTPPAPGVHPACPTCASAGCSACRAPTPPAPGDEPERCARHGMVDCACERAPGDGEGLRAEVERLCGDDYFGAFVAVEDLRAALAARDTDQEQRPCASCEATTGDTRFSGAHGAWFCPRCYARENLSAANDPPSTICGARYGDDDLSCLRDVGHDEDHGPAARDTDQGCTGAHDCPAARHIHGCFAERDTDQGAGDALAEVRAVLDEADRQAGLGPRLVGTDIIRAALARATPEAEHG
jgi:hypothetical protein